MTANKEKASVEMKYVSDDADGSPPARRCRSFADGGGLCRVPSPAMPMLLTKQQACLTRRAARH